MDPHTKAEPRARIARGSTPPAFHAANADVNDLCDADVSRLELKVVNTLAELDRLESEWDALLDASATPEPTQSWLWVITWWRVFGESGRQLRVVTVRDQGKLIGVFPLVWRVHWYRAIPFRRLELCGSGEKEADEIASEYIGPIVERGREGEVARAFVRSLGDRALGEWDELVFERMNSEAPSVLALSREFKRAGFAVNDGAHGAASYIPLPDSWEGYLKALSSSRRYRVRRALKDFTAWAGEEPKLCRVNDPSELSHGISVLIDLHEQRWQSEGRAGAFASAPFREFHERVMPELLRRGSLELCWLSVRGQPLAALYNIEWRGRVHFYQSGRRVDLPEKIRPGTVVHALAIRDAIERGLREYDFLAGSSRYKEELSLAARPLIQLRVTRDRLIREGARLLAQRGIRQARELVHLLKQRIGDA